MSVPPVGVWSGGLDLATVDYELLSRATAVAYVAADERLSQVIDPSAVTSVDEIGDGNLNLVYILRDRQGRGLVLKQALPYLRLVGPSWPLTPDRARHEAESLTVYDALAPGLVPHVYRFDPARFVIAMEDLSDHVVWREALNCGRQDEGVASDVGVMIARVAFGTSVFGMPREPQQAAMARSVNPQLCAITEDLVFTEPYVNAGRNRVLPANERDARELADDEAMVREIGWLKWQFMTRPKHLSTEIYIPAPLWFGMATPDSDRLPK